MTPSNGHEEDAPPGWATEARTDEIHSWVGATERLLCTDEGDGEWIVYSQPRGELGTSTQVRLTDDPTTLDRAISLAFEYMERNSNAE